MGALDNPEFQAITRSETCADLVKLMAVIDGDGHVKDIQAQVYGCGYAISGTSLFTDLAKHKNIDTVLEEAENATAAILPQVPERHRDCLILCHTAFRKILEAYKPGTADGTA